MFLYDGSRKRRHGRDAKARWYATWRTIRFAKRFGGEPRKGTMAAPARAAK